MHLLKRIEKLGKRGIQEIFLWVFASSGNHIPAPEKIQKIFIFRMDQRIGNGLMLLPLVRAIRKSLPRAQIHLLIHKPIAEFFDAAVPELFNYIWPYNQRNLLSHPWKFITLLRTLRRQRFNIIFSCHNPDNFSLSQAIMGKFCGGDCLIGFRWNDSSRVYDLAVYSSTEKHYADSMLDLWRRFDPQTQMEWGQITIPENIRKYVQQQYPQIPSNAILIWLGATNGKELPVNLVVNLYELFYVEMGLPVVFACGPADLKMIKNYPEWMQEQVISIRLPLIQTAAFFCLFQLFISGDTGPMHLAATLNMPMISFFQNTNIRQYGYNTDHQIAVGYNGEDDDFARIKVLVLKFRQQVKSYD